jgi:hypothetical protein
MHNKIWSYISNRFDYDGVLVDTDEVYLVYRKEFDNGVPTELIDEVLESFADIHDLTGITIEWEGYDATRYQGTRTSSQVSHQTA